MHINSTKSKPRIDAHVIRDEGFKHFGYKTFHLHGWCSCNSSRSTLTRILVHAHELSFATCVILVDQDEGLYRVVQDFAPNYRVPRGSCDSR